MKAVLAIAAWLTWGVGLAQSQRPIRIEIGIDGDPQHLVEELRAAGYEADIGVEASDQPFEETQGVWIGRDVPFENVKEIVHRALKKYPHLRYYKFFPAYESAPQWNHMVYVGGSKWAAYKDTRPIESEGAEVLFWKIRSSDDLRQLIESFQKCRETPNNALQPTCEDARG